MAFLSIACLCLSVAIDASAHAVQGDVTLMVKERNDSDKAAKFTYSQKVVLEITLMGKPHDPETRVVKWSIYGKDRKTDRVSVLKSGEARVEIGAGATQKITTEEVRTTSSQDHSVSSNSRGGRGRGRRVRYTKVEGTGVRYIGYSVQVILGDKVIAEKFDPKNLEKDFANAG